MNRLVCFFFGHIPKLSFRINRTKNFESDCYIKQRNKPFVVVVCICNCKRCGKFLTSAWWTE